MKFSRSDFEMQRTFRSFLTISLGHAASRSIDGAIHYIFMDWRHQREMIAAGDKVYDELMGSRGALPRIGSAIVISALSVPNTRSWFSDFSASPHSRRWSPRRKRSPTLIEVGGSGYIPEGEFSRDRKPIVEASPLRDGLERTLQAAALVNDSELTYSDERWRLQGDPTEGALVVAARKFGLKAQDLARFARIAEIPFTSERKRHTTVHVDPDRPGELRVRSTSIWAARGSMKKTTCQRLTIRGR